MQRIKEALAKKMEKPLEERRSKGGGLRFNTGKLKYELLDADAIEGIVKVLTYGLEKYTVKDENGNVISTGANNWRKGMEWSSIIGSLKRHLAAIEKGEDYDYDKNCPTCKSGERCNNHSGLLHIDHLMCNGMFLSAYYRIFPQGDNRNHKYLSTPSIGLDLDDVLADFSPAWCKRFDMPMPTAWGFDRRMKEKFAEMEGKTELSEFYMDLKPLVKPEDLPFEPAAYVTSRPVPSEISEMWLDMNGYPVAPVVTVGLFKSKVEALKELAIDIFVDDSYQNFKELNKAGIVCYLFDSHSNQRYDVGYKRIKKLSELPWFKQ